MDQPVRKIMSLAIILLFVSGCATTGNTPNSNSSNTDGTQTKVVGTLTGAGIGAAIGAGLAIATGHKDNIEGYTAIGAALGGLGGYVAGSKVAEIKEKYAKQEDALDEEIQVAAQFNQQTKDKNTETQNQINSLNQEISNLASGNIKTKQQINDLETKKNITNNMIADNNKTINDMTTGLNALVDYKKQVENTGNCQKVGKLEQEITALQSNIAMLDQSNRQMAQMVESLNVRK